MINVTDLKAGVFFMSDDQPYKVLGYEHIKVGRGGAYVKAKSKNLLTGSIKEITFNSGDRVEEADVINKNFQYLYADTKNLVFMDLEDYSQVELALEDASDTSMFLTEGKEFQLILYNGKPLSIMLPASMIFKVVEAPDAVKGDTSKSATKTIKLENGLEVSAPLFIKVGDVVKVNTESGQYVSRFN
jgi:elongation factor P